VKRSSPAISSQFHWTICGSTTEHINYNIHKRRHLFQFNSAWITLWKVGNTDSYKNFLFNRDSKIHIPDSRQSVEICTLTHTSALPQTFGRTYIVHNFEVITQLHNHHSLNFNKTQYAQPFSSFEYLYIFSKHSFFILNSSLIFVCISCRSNYTVYRTAQTEIPDMHS
jgi:hypothetical protein